MKDMAIKKTVFTNSFSPAGGLAPEPTPHVRVHLLSNTGRAPEARAYLRVVSCFFVRS